MSRGPVPFAAPQGGGLPDGVDLTETMAVWQVDMVDHSTADDLQPGTVSDGWGFADSPIRRTPKTAAEGDLVTVTVTLEHAPGWHTYAAAAAGSPYIATRVHLGLPAGWTTVGRWQAPEGVPFADEEGTRVAEGTAQYVRRVRVGALGPASTAPVSAKIGYLACDESRCLPPNDISVTTSVARR